MGQIAAQLGCHPRTVYRWLHRFNHGGLEDLGDLPRSGRPRRLGELERGRIIALVGSDPPGRLLRQPDGTLGLDRPEQADQSAQWTLDALAAAAQAEGIQAGRSQVQRILQAEGVRWRTVRSWSRSGDPEFAPRDSHALSGAATDENGSGLAELGVPWCSKPVQKTDAWRRPGTANCCCEHVLQRR